MLNRARAHDRRDFEEWYRIEAEDLTRRIVAGVGDPLIGREAAAEALARAFEKWHRVGAMDSPEGWVYRTAINLCRRSWRRSGIEARALKKAQQIEILPVSSDPDEVLVAGHGVDDLDALVTALPDRMRTAVRLRYWDGMSEAEVASVMQIAPGTASAMLSKARRRLEAAMAMSAVEEPGAGS
jgi:RNA polymerase sigma factor (sigma-70 family)